MHRHYKCNKEEQQKPILLHQNIPFYCAKFFNQLHFSMNKYNKKSVKWRKTC